MDSAEVARGLDGLKAFAQGTDAVVVLDESLACVLALIGHSIGADTSPDVDVGMASLRLALLSDAISRHQDTLDGSLHYVVAMGLEQVGFVSSTLAQREITEDPVDDDIWLRLAFAILHYLAGNYRVQSFASIERLRRDYAERPRYLEANNALRRLLNGTGAEGVVPRWARIFFEDAEPTDPVEAHLHRLARLVRRQRVMMLEQLGSGNVDAWLRARGVVAKGASDFWNAYITSLRNRGIVAFSKEQVGDGFDRWLRPEIDLLTVLPTGAGKSLVGELRTAMALASDKAVLWLLPTRALVRQTQRQMRRAFHPLGIDVRELPVTEDPMPLFADDEVERRLVACTTPERASALFRAQPTAMANIGLLVFDEAQILTEAGRGAVAERLVTDLRESTDCDSVFLTAFEDALETLRALLASTGTEPEVLRAPTRPSRRMYGVLSRRDRPHRHVEALFYPPQRSGEDPNDPLFSMALRSRAAGNSPLEAAMRFSREASLGGLRTVVFVRRKDSTEKHATEFDSDPESSYVGHSVPRELIPRLRLELGRESVLEGAMPKGALPHHAGLARLEQHLVEQFVLNGFAATVVATPTLAQGVNLPLDISIVTFLTRYNRDEKSTEPLAPSELHNMLGRAGRAGMVPDGFCLLAIDERVSPPRDLLRQNRRWLYPQLQDAQASGVIQLLRALERALLSSPNWITELDVVSFSEAQSILSLAATFALEPTRTAVEQLSRFPSFARLEHPEQGRLAASMTRLMVQLGDSASPRALGLIAKTGLPLEYVEHVVSSIDRGTVLEYLGQGWWDVVVREALGWPRRWCLNLRLEQPIASFFDAVELWRAGKPILDIERAWRTSSLPRAHRVKSGQYFNSGIGQVAQFWGIAPLALDAFGVADLVGEELKGMASFVREGLPSIDALLWRRALGDYDRVLAGRLAAVSPIEVTGSSMQRIRAAEEQLSRPTDLLASLNQSEADALRASLNEQAIIDAARG